MHRDKKTLKNPEREFVYLSSLGKAQERERLDFVERAEGGIVFFLSTSS